ncbi:piggyBac transposable element-derived protein 2-like [Ischnura elegans]|uniref:piggyBac transposable element-derived protein 2-like n=1 Tax=Ischnura elegans TaxID=197161 RepID=UPI001ED86D74|nr:piggyBac transposable element-derived protein 2-like [Ischnura elegans]
MLVGADGELLLRCANGSDVLDEGGPLEEAAAFLEAIEEEDEEVEEALVAVEEGEGEEEWDGRKAHRNCIKRGLRLNEILDALLEDDVSPESIAICPPVEEKGMISDQDSDLSDEEVEGDFSHLPARILQSEVHADFSEEAEERLVQNGRGNFSEMCETSVTLTVKKPKKRKRCYPVRCWEENCQDFASKIENVSPKYLPNAEDHLRETVNSPFDAFKAIFSECLVNRIVIESNRYAAQHLVHGLEATSDEIHSLIGVMLLSGYHRLSQKRMYWKVDPDCHVKIVADAIRRNKFENLLRYLHLADNDANNGSDRMYKVRPLFDFLNQAFKQIEPGNSLSIDESMILYYGRHGSKQFIRGKPIRFGFKLWVAADPTGYIHHAEPYCGSSTRLPDTGLGQGGGRCVRFSRGFRQPIYVS